MPELSQSGDNFLDYFSSLNSYEENIDKSYNKKLFDYDDNDLMYQNDSKNNEIDEINELKKSLEEDLIFFHEKKSELVSLYDKENYIRKYYNLEYNSRINYKKEQ